MKTDVSSTLVFPCIMVWVRQQAVLRFGRERRTYLRWRRILCSIFTWQPPYWAHSQKFATRPAVAAVPGTLTQFPTDRSCAAVSVVYLDATDEYGIHDAPHSCVWGWVGVHHQSQTGVGWRMLLSALVVCTCDSSTTHPPTLTHRPVSETKEMPRPSLIAFNCARYWQWCLTARTVASLPLSSAKSLIKSCAWNVFGRGSEAITILTCE